MPFLLLFISGLLLVLGSLTAVEIRGWMNWKLAVLAGEYGHRVAPVAAAIAALAVVELVATPSGVTGLVVVCAVTALGLLLKPTWQAARIGRGLPAQFDAFAAPTVTGAGSRPTAQRGGPRKEHGGESDAGTEPPFRISTYFRRQPPQVAVQTHRFTSQLELDFFPPVTTRGLARAPCVLVIHGGGWDSGDQRQFTSFHHALAQAGFAVAAMTYRLAPQHRWPAQEEDILTALSWLKAHADALVIDANRLVLLGRSAGAHLALTAAYRNPDPAVRGVVSLYGPADLEFAWNCGNLDKVLDSPKLMTQLIGTSYPVAADAYRQASAYFFVGRKTPPTLLMHGRLDPLVWYRQSRRLAARLAEHGVPHLHVEFPWATHAFDYKIHGPGGQLTLWSVLRFARAVT